MSEILRVVKTAQVLESDAAIIAEFNLSVPEADRIEPERSGLLNAINAEGKVVLILNEHVPAELLDQWVKQPVMRAHRRRMKKALDLTYPGKFSC
jgi:hypothetical protein